MVNVKDFIMFMNGMKQKNVDIRDSIGVPYYCPVIDVVV